VLKLRKPVILTKPMAAPEQKLPRVGDIACDEGLFERLRGLRRRLADERGVPPYIIFSDVTLRQMAREYPSSERELSRINGVGEKKRIEFGEKFLAEVAEHLRTNARQIFADDSFQILPPSVRRPQLGDTSGKLFVAFVPERTVTQIAHARSLAESTIYSHLATAIEAGHDLDVAALLSPEEQREIEAAFEKIGFDALSPVKDFFGERFDYGKLRICRAVLQRAGKAV
jgi:ATP-dependent DNA helicase RecQ